MLNMDTEKKIAAVAGNVSEIVQGCCGVTLGGSRACGMDDGDSDVEMYFYSDGGAPDVDELNACLKKLGARHRRCSEFLWNEKPWGPHSFFMLDDLYFEIGYRNTGDIRKKIERYLAGDVMPHEDCHDLGLGYLYGSLAASVAAEKELILCGDEIAALKALAGQFPESLCHALKEEYLNTARSFIYGKLNAAVIREDMVFYDVIASRVVRCLMIMAFAMSKKHFPGDKWNEKLLVASEWTQARKFAGLIREHCLFKAESADMLHRKWQLLERALKLIEADA